jgi:uncharacterized BrkB/YihY/UPF0761 family membrane protein
LDSRATTEPPPERADGPDAQRSRRRRVEARADAVKARAEHLAERAEAERARHRSLDAAFEIADHDSQVGGSIMAGALAYRLFIWLLPLALVAIAGLGVAADAFAESPQRAARSIGLAGLVAGSVASAAKESTRWYALLVGIPLLFIATRSVLRTLIVTHRLVWMDDRGRAPKPSLLATAQLLAALILLLVFSALASAARARSTDGGVLVTLVALLPYGGLWLLVSRRLPHGRATWRTLWPGALLFAVGLEVLHFVTAYIIAPEAASKQGTYGALGVAAALLLGLFLLSRLVIAAAVLNVTVWRRHARPPIHGHAESARSP